MQLRGSRYWEFDHYQDLCRLAIIPDAFLEEQFRLLSIAETHNRNLLILKLPLKRISALILHVILYHFSQYL